MKNPRCSFLVLAAAIFLGFSVTAQPHLLTAERHGDHVRVSAPQLHFLSGKALARLHDGSAVDFTVTLTAAAAHDKRPAITVQDRFTVSFDLWEEKYSVVQQRQDGRSASRLTAVLTEAWILDGLPLPVQALPDRQPFIIRLECSMDPGDAGNGRINGPGLTLAGLIDVFSRKENDKPLRWEASTGLLRLSALKNSK